MLEKLLRKLRSMGLEITLVSRGASVSGGHVSWGAPTQGHTKTGPNSGFGIGIVCFAVWSQHMIPIASRLSV